MQRALAIAQPEEERPEPRVDRAQQLAQICRPVPRLGLDIDTTVDLRALRRAGQRIGRAARAALHAIAAG